MSGGLEENEVLLFQYGSNMLRGRLVAQIEKYAPRYAPPDASLDVRLVGRGRLTGWRFVFDLYSSGQDCRVSDIVEAEGEVVWGAVYALDRELVERSDGQRSLLDRIEGHRPERNAPNYEPRVVSVDVDGTPYDAITYVGREDARERCLLQHADARVGADYVADILAGARELDLPRAYQEDLAAAASSDK